MTKHRSACASEGAGSRTRNWTRNHTADGTALIRPTTLVNDLLELMQASEADYTLTFRYLADTLDAGIPDRLEVMFGGSEGFHNWLDRWHQRLGEANAATVADEMRQTNPIYIPRNHRIEQAIAAAEAGDFDLMHELQEVLHQPFTENDAYLGYENPPMPSERVYRTFCGT